MFTGIIGLAIKVTVAYLLVATGVYVALRKYNPSDISVEENAKRIYAAQALALPFSMIGAVFGGFWFIMSVSSRQVFDWFARIR